MLNRDISLESWNVIDRLIDWLLWPETDRQSWYDPARTPSRQLHWQKNEKEKTRHAAMRSRLCLAVVLVLASCSAPSVDACYVFPADMDNPCREKRSAESIYRHTSAWIEVITACHEVVRSGAVSARNASRHWTVWRRAVSVRSAATTTATRWAARRSAVRTDATTPTRVRWSGRRCGYQRHLGLVYRHVWDEESGV